MRASARSGVVLLCALCGLASVRARAQSALDELDPDSKNIEVKKKPEAEPEPEPRPPPREDEPEPSPTPHPAKATHEKSERGTGQVVLPPRGEAKAAEPETEKPAEAAAAPAPRPALKPILLATQGDADLQGAWERWRKAEAQLDRKTAQAELDKLLALEQELGISDLDAYAVGVGRASAARIEGNDPTGAIDLATAAVALAPDLPITHLALARAYQFADTADFVRYTSELKRALTLFWTQPRYARTELVDLMAAVFFALLATAAAVTVVLFVKVARYFLHDFHHLFPKAARPWQSAALALLLLAIPLVFRTGVASVLLALFAASILYLRVTERLVAAALIALVGGIPYFARLVVERTAFDGTPAESVFVLDQGGPGAQPVADEIVSRLGQDKADPAEIFALARFELRRGKLDAAVDHFKKAASKRPNDARILTNLGNAMLAKEDLEGAIDAYSDASKADPSFAPALWDLSRAISRRAAKLSAAEAALEIDKAQTAEAAAERIDPSLLARKDPPDDQLYANRLLINPGLAREDLIALSGADDRGAKIQQQLSLQLLGDVGPFGMFYPGALAALLFVLGQAAGRLRASKSCERCGRPVCRRCDPEIGPLSERCGQCFNAFSRKSDVPAAVRVRKQIEIDHYRTRTNRLSYLFGLLLSGAGHLFSGLPIRGALYAFLFLFGVFNLFFRQGLLRAPFGGMPVMLRLIPLAIALLAVYGLSLLGLYRRQTEE